MKNKELVGIPESLGLDYCCDCHCKLTEDNKSYWEVFREIEPGVIKSVYQCKECESKEYKGPLYKCSDESCDRLLMTDEPFCSCGKLNLGFKKEDLN